MKTKYVKITGVAVLLVLLLILAAATYKRQKGSDAWQEKIALEAKKQYVCSMHPQVLRDEPGDCPICGMFLIEKMDQNEQSFDSSLTHVVCSVNETVLASVRNVTAEEAVLPVLVKATGIVNYDPRKIQTVSARFGGVVERSFIKYQFQHVRKGQKIYEIYCPDIYTDKWNYVKLIQGYPDRDDLTGEALEWFHKLGLSDGQIDSLKRMKNPDFHLAVYSPAEGYAVSSDFDPETFFFNGAGEPDRSAGLLAGGNPIGLNDGITAETGDPLFKLIDLNSLRIDLKVKSEEVALIKNGQAVVVYDATNPDIKLNSEISQIEPLNGGLFQTVKVFVNDPDRLLLPGRLIKAEIAAGSKSGLWVPVSSVVDMGQIKSVFLKQGNRYIATEVITGLRLNDKIEILYGIEKGSEIAGKALLMTDSDGFVATVSSSAELTEMPDKDSLSDEKNIRLSDAQIRLSNISSSRVREGSIGRKLSLPGVLKVNEQAAVTISSRIPGRIEKLYFRNSGESVKKGEKLYEFYSEDLIKLQREYFTIQSNNWNFSGRYEPSILIKNKLLLMGMLPEQIEQLARDGKILFTVTIFSPASGKIRSVSVTEGQYVSSGQPMFELAEDKRLWIEAQAYPDDIRLLRSGMPALVTFPSSGEYPLMCKLSFITPGYEQGKNVNLVRAEIDNHDNHLHPGMFAMLNISTSSAHGIIIPLSALITGSRGSRVWVMQGNGSYSWRNVTEGIHSGDSVHILSGLDIDDYVVTSGVYLLDSELILNKGEDFSSELAEK